MVVLLITQHPADENKDIVSEAVNPENLAACH